MTMFALNFNLGSPWGFNESKTLHITYLMPWNSGENLKFHQTNFLQLLWGEKIVAMWKISNILKFADKIDVKEKRF